MQQDKDRAASRRRAVQLYFLGQGTVVLGAAAMTALHSFVPMALAGSAALMLTAPLVRDIADRRRVRAAARRERDGR
jgi:hypothetical protein